MSLIESRYQLNYQSKAGYNDYGSTEFDKTQAESPSKCTDKSHSPMTKSRLRKDPTYMRPKKIIPNFHSKALYNAMMTPEQKRALKDKEQNIEFERRVYLLRKMSENEKVRLILRRSQDKTELSTIRDMIKHQNPDIDYINQRTIRYL